MFDPEPCIYIYDLLYFYLYVGQTFYANVSYGVHLHDFSVYDTRFRLFLSCSVINGGNYTSLSHVL